MAFYSGNTGTIQFKKQGATDFKDNAAVNLRVTKWTINSSARLLDVTTLGDYDKSSVYGLRTHTGTLDLLYYTEDDFSTPAKNSAAWFINALMRADTVANAANSDFANDTTKDSYPVRLKLYLKGAVANTAAQQDAVEFDANLTSVGFASTVGEITRVQVQFEASGQIAVASL